MSSPIPMQKVNQLQRLEQLEGNKKKLEEQLRFIN